MHVKKTEGADLASGISMDQVVAQKLGDLTGVAIDDEAVLIAPYASRLPYQLMLAPRRPRARPL